MYYLYTSTIKVPVVKKNDEALEWVQIPQDYYCEKMTYLVPSHLRGKSLLTKPYQPSF